VGSRKVLSGTHDDEKYEVWMIGLGNEAQERYALSQEAQFSAKREELFARICYHEETNVTPLNVFSQLMIGYQLNAV